MRILTPKEKAFLDVFLIEATTSPFTGPATRALHAIGVEYSDISNIAWAYEQDVPRTSVEVGHLAEVAPPVPWSNRDAAVRRDKEIKGIREQEATATQVLLDRVHAGDKDAENELLIRYLPRIMAVVRARLGAELRQKLDSMDIAQDAMMASLKNIGDFDNKSEGAFIKWFAKIVENIIRDKIDHFHADKRDLRKEKPLPAGRSPDSSIPLDIPDKSGVLSPSQVVVLNEDRARVDRAMDQLSQEQRELIIAVKYEGRSFQEIAEEQGKSPDAVRMQVNRAMAALTRAFRKLDAGGKENDRAE